MCDNIIAVADGYRDYRAFIDDPANGFRSMTLPFPGGFEMSLRI